MDDKTLLANVLLEVRSESSHQSKSVDAIVAQDDQYESLEIAYRTITSIRADRGSLDHVDITLTLSGPPRLGKDTIRPQGLYSDGGLRALEAAFSIPAEQADRLSRALTNRGLVGSSPTNQGTLVLT